MRGGRVVNEIPSVGQTAIGAVEIAELGFGGDHAFETADELGALCHGGLPSGRPLDAEGREDGLDEGLNRLEVVWTLAEGQVHALDTDCLIGLAHLEGVFRGAAEEALALRLLTPVRLE